MDFTVSALGRKKAQVYRAKFLLLSRDHETQRQRQHLHPRQTLQDASRDYERRAKQMSKGKVLNSITVTSCQDSSYKKSLPITERVRDRQYDFPYQNVQKGNKSQIPLNVLLRISLVKVYKCACAETN